MSLYPTTGATQLIPPPPQRIEPQAGRQLQFLSHPADIVIYGGAAGGGKTFALLLDPLRHIRTPHFNAVIFRRTYPEVTQAGGLWEESEGIYPHVGGDGVRGDLIWRWPHDATVRFSHLQYEDDLNNYLGAQICMLGFDQLEGFTEKQLFFMIGRNRSMCGIRPYVRATCNPDPDSFLRKFLDWWIADDGYADLSRAGKTRWFVRINNEIVWANTKEELEAYYIDSDPLSVSFIPATIFDNSILMRRDPGYLAKLKAQDYIDKARLLGDPQRGGNWDVRPEAGKVFNRSWFEIVPQAPAGGIEGRGWDMAATIKSVKNNNPDYTASVRMRKVGGYYYILDATEDRIAAGEVESFFYAVSAQDKQSTSSRYLVRWEIEPGSASIRESDRMARELGKKLPGLDRAGVPVSGAGDKMSRWKQLAAAANNGKIRIVMGAWADNFMSHMHMLPDSDHDDMADAAAVIFNVLSLLPEEQVRRERKESPLARMY